MSQSFLPGKVVCGYPLVTLSRRSDVFPLGLASALPRTLAARPGLHLVQPVWYIDEASAQLIAARWHDYRAQAPAARLVFLTNEDTEAKRLEALGLPAFRASVGAFIDERPWVAATGPAEPEFDALYNAVLLPFKRHTLASRVESLALLYRADVEHRREAAREGLRYLLPQARFLNHELGQGSYRQLGPDAAAAQLRRARVGLALSRREGLMRACVEYLLAGLPVVSTVNEGGRAQWLEGPWARVVADSPRDVAAAVDDFCRSGPAPEEVRAVARTLLAAERLHVAEVVDGLCRETFGAEAPALRVPEDFCGLWRFRPLPELVAELGEAGLFPLDPLQPAPLSPLAGIPPASTP